ncbi:hypothetical protein LWC35_38030 [Pseudonocardia kujensis]|uniref:hypothetical protein n=1 Tax=Pseudonocardia kujensis TaxID=1128675 RepID=UPI001E328686|nr:hypothetical protein [Pseudonocardia kujensis]MCE0768653.1 hypothetical protein [Pseudonocardia kujensis]
MRLLPAVLSAAVLGAVLAAGACGTASAGSRVDTPAPAAPAAERAATQDVLPQPAPVAPPRPVSSGGASRAPVADPGMDAAADGLRPFLLTPAEIGPGFTAGEEPRPDPATPALCGGPGVVAQFPYAVRVGAAAERPDGLVQETVSVYGDEASAAEAYRASITGMSCSQGHVDGRPAAIAPAEDLRADLGHDEATGWRVGGEGFDVVMIAVRDGEVLMNFTVLAPEDGLATLPDPLTIAQAGSQKLLG